jgi:hypothetical protein
VQPPQSVDYSRGDLPELLAFALRANEADVTVLKMLVLGLVMATAISPGAAASPPAAVQTIAYAARACHGSAESCRSIGAAQRELWAEAALAVPALKELMSVDGLAIQRNRGAGAEVMTLDAASSTVVVELHVADWADPVSSTVSVLFDNSTDRSASSKGVRIGPMRAKNAAPVALSVSATLVVSPSISLAGSLRRVSSYVGARGTLDDNVWSALDFDTVSDIPKISASARRGGPHADITQAQRAEFERLIASLAADVRAAQDARVAYRLAHPGLADDQLANVSQHDAERIGYEYFRLHEDIERLSVELFALRREYERFCEEDRTCGAVGCCLM